MNREACSKTNSPESSRRCRIALLPDCHVQPGNDRLPTRPTKRLYGAARQLLETSMERMDRLDVDAVFLLGDTLDPADDEGIAWLTSVIDRSNTPVFVIVGNHETYGRTTVEQFHRAFGLPEHGNHVAWVNEVPFVMLATPDQESLAPGGFGYQWLRERLDELDSGTDLFCCAHFSLLLHPCVQGAKNDGMQVLWSSEKVLSLLRRYPRVRGWFAGHKNVPSRMVRDGKLHLLSPQLIQAPCGFRVLDVFENGLRSQVYAIEEQELAWLSQLAYGNAYAERCGDERDRDFWWSWK
jgi:hypothetical protein